MPSWGGQAYCKSEFGMTIFNLPLGSFFGVIPRASLILSDAVPQSSGQESLINTAKLRIIWEFCQSYSGRVAEPGISQKVILEPSVLCLVL